MPKTKLAYVGPSAEEPTRLINLKINTDRLFELRRIATNQGQTVTDLFREAIDDAYPKGTSPAEIAPRFRLPHLLTQEEYLALDPPPLNISTTDLAATYRFLSEHTPPVNINVPAPQHLLHVANATRQGVQLPLHILQAYPALAPKAFENPEKMENYLP